MITSTAASEITAPPRKNWFRRFKSLHHNTFVHCVLANALNIGGAQVVRLGGNLILTRLLYPEAFGLMALVNIFIVGLAMFSDLGIGLAVVQRKAEPDRSFLDTAWTIQVLRGLAISALTFLIATPVSDFYREPALAYLVPAIGLTEAIAGFKSPAIHLCARSLRHFPLTFLDLGTSILGLSVSAALAFLYPGVWALVAGSAVAVSANTLGSFFLPGHMRPRFAINPSHTRELFRFGKWVTIGTAFAFLATQGDRLILGRFLSAHDLGIYTIAFFFAQSAAAFISGVANRVLVPVLAKLQGAPPAERRAANLRYRSWFLAGSLVPIATFLLAGPALIDILYDDRYLPAGRYLQILSLGSAPAVLRILIAPVFIANGNSSRRMILNGCESISLLGCMAAGGAAFGLEGFLWGFVAGQLLAYPVALWLAHPYRILSPSIDFCYLSICAALGFVGFRYSSFPFWQ